MRCGDWESKEGLSNTSCHPINQSNGSVVGPFDSNSTKTVGHLPKSCLVHDLEQEELGSFTAWSVDDLISSLSYLHIDEMMCQAASIRSEPHLSV